MFQTMVSETVEKLLGFVEDFDPYEYLDAEIEDERLFLTESLTNGDEGTKAIRDTLEEYIDESEQLDLILEGCALIRRLDVLSMVRNGYVLTPCA